MNRNLLVNEKSPIINRGFFLCAVMFDFLILFFSSSNLFLLIEFFLLQLVYFFYLKGNMKKIISIVIISLVIFICNLFQITGGRALYSNKCIIITTQSVHLGAEKSLLLLCLFLISSNCVYQNRNLFITQSVSSLFSLSVQKFFYLFEGINFKSRNMLRHIYFWFYRSLFYLPNKTCKSSSPSLKSFFCFHVIFFIFMICGIFLFTFVF